jgi:hypothetical protein
VREEASAEKTNNKPCSFRSKKRPTSVDLVDYHKTESKNKFVYKLEKSL